MTDFSLKSKPAHPARQHLDKLDTLQRSMLEALDEDQVKKQLNDAKLRGVAQHVEYDDFEKLVKGAHLRPIKPRSTELDAIGRAFDGFVMPKVEAKVNGPLAQPHLTPALNKHEQGTSVPSVPSSSNEFLRVWRRQLKSAEQRHTYIRQLDPAALPILFRTELDAGLFDSIVDALSDPLLARMETALEVAGGSGAYDATEEGDGSRTEPLEATDLLQVPSGDKINSSTNSDAPSDGAAAAAAADDTTLHSDLTWACDFLYHISRLNRFDLTLDFASKATTGKLMRLFKAILARKGAEGSTGHDHLPSAADVLSLQAAFQLEK